MFNEIAVGHRLQSNVRQLYSRTRQYYNNIEKIWFTIPCKSSNTIYQKQCYTTQASKMVNPMVLLKARRILGTLFKILNKIFSTVLWQKLREWINFAMKSLSKICHSKITLNCRTHHWCIKFVTPNISGLRN